MVEVPDIVVATEDRVSQTFDVWPPIEPRIYHKIIDFYCEYPGPLHEFWRDLRQMRTRYERREAYFPRQTTINHWISSLDSDTPSKPVRENCIATLEDYGFLEWDAHQPRRVLRSSNEHFPYLALHTILCIFSGTDLGFAPRISGSLDKLEPLKELFEEKLGLGCSIKELEETNILVPDTEIRKPLGRLLHVLGAPSERKTENLRMLPPFIYRLGKDFMGWCAHAVYEADGWISYLEDRPQLRIGIPKITNQGHYDYFLGQICMLLKGAIGVPFNDFPHESGTKVYSVIGESGIEREEYDERITRFLEEHDLFLTELGLR
jgi:hypothetical protein